MAKKKKTKKITKSKKTTGRATASKKLGTKRLPAKKATLKKKLAKKKVVAKAPKKRAREKDQVQNPVTASVSARSGRLSGDLQGISSREAADSESVDELLEEGNTFEAGVVGGVERADDDETEEVHTRQFPEDDVPGEYLDED